MGNEQTKIDFSVATTQIDTFATQTRPLLNPVNIVRNMHKAIFSVHYSAEILTTGTQQRKTAPDMHIVIKNMQKYAKVKQTSAIIN